MNILIKDDILLFEIYKLLKNSNIHEIYLENNIYNNLEKYKPLLYIGTQPQKIKILKEYNCYGLIVKNTGKNYKISYINKSGETINTYVYDCILQQKQQVKKIDCFKSDIICINELENKKLLKLCNYLNKFKIRIFGPEKWNCGQYLGKINNYNILSAWFSSKIVFTSNLNTAINASQYSLVVTDNQNAEEYGIITIKDETELVDICTNYLIQNPHLLDEQFKIFTTDYLTSKFSKIPTYKNILENAELSMKIKLI